MKKVICSLAFVFFICFSAVAEIEPLWGRCYSVVGITENLRLRSEGNTSSSIVTTLQAGSLVRIVGFGDEETIDGITDKWIKVETTDCSKDRDGNDFQTVLTGWCFGGYTQEIPYHALYDEEEARTFEEPVKSSTGDYYLTIWQTGYYGCLWKKVVYFGPAGQVTLDAVRAGANGSTLYEKPDENSAVVGKLAPESFALIKEKGERISRSDFVVDGVTYKYTWICRWVYVEDLATDQSGWMYDLTFDGK